MLSCSAKVRPVVVGIPISITRAPTSWFPITSISIIATDASSGAGAPSRAQAHDDPANFSGTGNNSSSWPSWRHHGTHVPW
eukprot:1404698-Rhodomonas_salina.2